MTAVARFALAVLTVGALIGPMSAHGQLVAGVFGARARDTFGGTNGIGAEAGVSLPFLPLEVFGAGTLFFPACAGCDFKGWSLGVNFSVLPLPVLHPYVTFGRTWRNLEDPISVVTIEDKGFFAGAGVEIVLPGFGVFAEGRYEFLTQDAAPIPDRRQWMLRAGLLLRWGGLPL